MEECMATTIKSNDAGHANGNHFQAARLLSNDAEAIGRNARAMREARDEGCVLTQAHPAGLYGDETSPPKAATLECGLSSVPPATSAYETGTRIACIDRVIIRMYFHPDEAGAFEPREKSAGVAKPAAGQKTRNTGSLPAELERMLTPLPAGYCRMRRGNAVLLVEEGTHKVLDAVRDVCANSLALV
jgi:hypothetical protein